MPSCAFRKCSHNTRNTNKSNGITFHSFPQDPRIKEKWIKIIQEEQRDETWLPTQFSRICSAHFTEDMFYLTPTGRKKIKHFAVPLYWTQPPAGEESFPTITVYPDTVKVEDTRSGSPLSDGLISDTDSIFDTPFVSSLKAQLEAEKRMSQMDKERLNKYRSQIRILRKRLKYYKNRTAKLKIVVKTMNNKMGTYKTVINKLTETIKNAKRE